MWFTSDVLVKSWTKENDIITRDIKQVFKYKMMSKENKTINITLTQL